MDGTGAGGTGAKADELIARLRQQVEEQQIQELVQTMSEKCFEKCVTRPGTSLTTGEMACLSKCADRYTECMSLVFSAVARKAQQQGP